MRLSSYQGFDEIAKQRRGVYKVETVGDCYVAVSGVPEFRKDHAVIMARFASDCMRRMGSLSKQLEKTLGPDTADLSLRIGLHSGPVIAGILRGDRARFQLFGDTVNTTARIESTGVQGKIHVSAETASMLEKAGKGHWTTPRNETVVAKGKGVMSTYWLDVKNIRVATSDHSSSSDQQTDFDALGPEADESKRARLVDWNTDVLSGLLRQIIARREAKNSKRRFPTFKHQSEEHVSDGSEIHETVFDEVKEIVVLPVYDPSIQALQKDSESVTLAKKVQDQLRNFVQVISQMYHDNAFHNFEHASHCTMSVSTTA